MDMANTMVARTAFLILVAVARGAAWLLEQPRSSVMPLHPRMMKIQELGAMLATHGLLHHAVSHDSHACQICQKEIERQMSHLSQPTHIPHP